MMRDHRLFHRAGGLGFLVLAAVAWFACAGSRAPKWGNAETGYILSYRGKPGDRMVYKSVRHGVNTSEQEGQTRESNDDQNGVFDLEVEKSDTAISFVFRIDTLDRSFSFGGEKRPMPDEGILGKRFRLRIAPTGVQQAFTPIDSIPPPPPGERRFPGPRGGRRGGPGGFGNYVNFYVLPIKPVKVGDSWTEIKHDSITDADTTRHFSRTNITDSKITTTILAEEIHNGIPCLHLKGETKYSVRSYGTMMGSEMTSEGDGENSADIWFAHTLGLLVEMNENRFYEGTSAFGGPSSGGVGSQTTDTHIVLNLVRHIPK